MASKTKIKRSCIVCGKKMAIKIADNGKYDKGHYFGKMKVPIEGTGKYVKTETFKHFDLKGNIVKWTGKEKEFGYWECENCFNED